MIPAPQTTREQKLQKINPYLHTMYSQARSCVQFLMTYVAFEMFCFLVLYKDLLIIKISITIPDRYCQGTKTAQ